MKKTILLLMALMPLTLFGQETATVDVTTSIQGNFTITPQNLDFGNVQQGDFVSIAIDGTTTNAGSSATRGQLLVTGTTADVIYTVSGANLNATNGTVLTIPKTSGSGADVDLVITLVYGTNSTTPVSYVPGTSTNGADDIERSFVMGGSFTSPAASAGNTYSTSLTISVSYN